MGQNTERNVLLVTILMVLLSAAGFVYAHYIDTNSYYLALESKDILLTTSNLKQDELKTQIAETVSELDAKKKEVAKATSDLAAKIKELSDANTRIKSQEAQITANAAELSKLRTRPPLFSFKVESSSVANIEQKKEDIKQLVTDAYDVIRDVYSDPYLLHSVAIAFVDSFANDNAAAEITISNGKDGLSITIKLKDFDKTDFNDVNSIIHEIIHSFHGLAVFDVQYEEGITVAATDAVMTKLIASGKIPAFSPLYIRITASQYASAQSLPKSQTEFYGDNAAAYYQTAGYGWYEMYKVDSNFFKTFNEKVYTIKRNGNELTNEVVLQAIKDSFKGQVQGKSTDEWLQTKAFVLN